MGGAADRWSSAIFNNNFHCAGGVWLQVALLGASEELETRLLRVIDRASRVGIQSKCTL